MTYLARTTQWAVRLFARPLNRISSGMHRFFSARPAAKRILLVALVFGIPVIAVHLLMPLLAPLVTAQLAVLLIGAFLGMGAERASTDWDDFFALPPLSAFAVWRWYPIERMRFLAAISSIFVLWVISVVWRAL